jgi:hypothetical protein
VSIKKWGHWAESAKSVVAAAANGMPRSIGESALAILITQRLAAFYTLKHALVNCLVQIGNDNMSLATTICRIRLLK